MDVSDEALIQVWASLNGHNLKYIMVGGFATRFHGFNSDIYFRSQTLQLKHEEFYYNSVPKITS